MSRRDQRVSLLFGLCYQALECCSLLVIEMPGATMLFKFALTSHFRVSKQTLKPKWAFPEYVDIDDDPVGR